ncbi:hypothetical protein O181_035611 [Austropuccinia psidii MF-1]|uniref:HAT C-terminal dimerisation domain-containing protein n=1 Tax=Austropuccinia psidii MF-1 TaxID=1389203 RepID=A0A9Q3H940_9BASI|nr:hypothetical protein [Austropuccinia psidii MF-1]
MSNGPTESNIAAEDNLTNNNKLGGIFDEMYPLAPPGGSSLKSELNQYFMEPLEPKLADVLLFWKSRGAMFPTLVQMAHQYLAILATSAPSDLGFGRSLPRLVTLDRRRHPINRRSQDQTRLIGIDLIGIHSWIFGCA